MGIVVIFVTCQTVAAWMQEEDNVSVSGCGLSCLFVFSLFLSLSSRLLTLASHLYSQDAKDNEEGAADDHDVADGLQ